MIFFRGAKRRSKSSVGTCATLLTSSIILFIITSHAIMPFQPRQYQFSLDVQSKRILHSVTPRFRYNPDF
jgi:hypothetical protein